jgi:hypothetical protein
VLFCILTFAGVCAACADRLTAPSASSDRARESITTVVDGIVYPKVTISPAVDSLKTGDSTVVQALLTDTSGSWTGRYVGWASSDTTVLRLAITGVGTPGGSVAHVTALKAGKATITASTLSHASDSSRVTVPAFRSTNAPAWANGVRAVRADSFVSSVGVATHFSYWDLAPYGAHVSQTVAAVTGAGFRFVRDALMVESTPGWNDRYWGVLRSLTEQGVHIVLITQPGPGVSAPYTNQSNLDTAVARLGAASILAFEGPNEVDLNPSHWGGPRAYGANARAYQRAMYQHAKQLAPAIPVLGLTAVTAAGAAPVGDLSGAMDFATLHPYPDGGVPRTNLGPMQRALGLLNGAHKPWWVTESGYQTAPGATAQVYQPGVSETAQGKYALRLYLDYFNAGISHTAMYELIDERADPTNAEMNYGLLHSDGSPKPAYTAIKNLLALLADPGGAYTPGTLSYSLTGAPSTLRQSLFQKRDGRFYLVLWNDLAVYDVKAKRDMNSAKVPVTLRLDASHRLAVYEPLSRAEALSVSASVSSLELWVPDHPLIVEISR